MLRTSSIGVLALHLLLLGSLASAATHHVPGDVPTIEEAFEIAQPGDVILVAPGNYEVDPIDVMTANLSLLGEGPGISVLLGDHFQPMFDVHADGFVLENVHAGPGCTRNPGCPVRAFDVIATETSSVLRSTGSR